MKWIKKGLIFSPDFRTDWMSYYSMMPTPEYLPDENLLIIYFGTTDKYKNGRTTKIILDADNPSKIIENPKQQLIEPGDCGFFDDCGAIPSSVINIADKKLLFYVGFQRVEKVPYMLFPGLAISSDNGKTFIKYGNAPIIDRTKDFPVSFAAPTVIPDNGIYKMWLWIGKSWTEINKKKYIKANIGYAESKDGYKWEIISDTCIVINETAEFSVGRPSVIHENNLFKMWYSVRYIDKLYRLGYAESKDGINWIRKDDEVGIDVSETGWDSEMICYPAVIKVKDKTYLFYNGNNNGETGFGYAELTED